MDSLVLDIPAILLNLFIVLLLVFLNGFFVAAEFALVKVRQTRLQQLDGEGVVKAKYALTVTKNLDAYLSATQFGITLASLALGWVGEPAISELIVEPIFHAFGLGPSLAIVHTISVIIAFAIVTFLHIVLGELAPKSFAIQKSEGTSLWLALPLIVFYRIFRPFIAILNICAAWVLRMLKVKPISENEAAHTE